MILKEVLNPDKPREQRDADNRIVRDANGQPELIPAGVDVENGRHSVKVGERILVPPHVALQMVNRWQFLQLGDEVEVKPEPKKEEDEESEKEPEKEKSKEPEPKKDSKEKSKGK